MTAVRRDIWRAISRTPPHGLRVFIAKSDGRPQPLGVTALEDKIVQRATVEVLNRDLEG